MIYKSENYGNEEQIKNDIAKLVVLWYNAIMKMGKRRVWLLYIALLGCLAIIVGSLLAFGGKEGASAATVPTPAVKRYALPEQISGLFTDYTCTALADEDISEEDIHLLKEKYTDEACAAYLDRAEQIVKGDVKFTELGEFSTQPDGENEIYQIGNRTTIFSKLDLRYYTSDLILTGIYGLSGNEIKVFVEADTNNLPKLIITQNHGYWDGGYRQEITLQRGMNIFTYSDFVTYVSQIKRNEVKGGAIYLSNAYTREQQGDVKVYIEGDGFYPVFERGDDEAEFLGMLGEYETERRANADKLLDMAELVTDHTIITTTSSSLYENYILNKTISPTLNSELWGDFMTRLLEFNGIATSPESHNRNWDENNDYLNVNFRYMSEYPNSGAYTTNYHIGYYYEHDWFANFYANIENRKIYNIAHEVGHQIDTYERKIDETTNNMTATYAYLNLMRLPATAGFQPYERSFEALSCDYNLSYNAFKDGHILYPQDDARDRNYMIWWYLESVFPNFWADLNNAFREGSASGLTDNEKMVYYSSLVTGVDLSEYYERWGFYRDNQYNKFNRNNTSETFKNLMRDERIKKDYDHFWLADNAEYDFIRKNLDVSEEQKEYDDVPKITGVERTDDGRKISVTNAPNISHLGYEIYSSTDGENYKIAGFTYSNTFIDKHNYGALTPTYKAIAVNRYFKTTKFSDEASEGSGGESYYVCEVDGEKFALLQDAVYSVVKEGGKHIGKTIYLLADCHIDGIDFYKNLSIEVAPEKVGDVTITCGNGFMFKSNANFSVTGKSDARIVIEGGSIDRSNAAFMLGSGEDKFTYVTFKNCKTKDRGGAICQIFGSITLDNCNFINCASLNDNCAIYIQSLTGVKALRIKNCKFENDNADICSKESNVNIVFDGSVPSLTLDLHGLDGAAYIACENFEVTADDLANIGFTNPQYEAYAEDGKIKITIPNITLKFTDGENVYQITVNGKNFTFGSEILEGFDEKKYISEYFDAASRTTYVAGDSIEIDGDMTFDVTVKDKFALELEFMGEKSTEYFAENQSVYLPLSDGAGNRIYRWLSPDGCYFAGKAYKMEQSLTVSADYAGYYRAQFSVDGVITRYDYKKYGEQIITAECNAENFTGWLADGALIGANEPYTIKKNVTLYALSDDGKTYNLNAAVIEIDGSGFTYTGSEITPRIRVTIDGEEVPELFYKTEYSDNIDAGAAAVTVKPNWTNAYGQKTANFTISARAISGAEVTLSDIPDFTYDGEEKTINPTVSVNGKTLKAGTDYDILYLDNATYAGTVNYKIAFKGNYSGEIQRSFNILKAQRPSVQSNVITVDYEVNALADITPPPQFEWVDGSIKIEGTEITALARYIGDDAANYQTCEVEFKIIIERETEPEPSNPPAQPDPPEQTDPPDGDGEKTEQNSENTSNTRTILLATLIPSATIAAAAGAFIFIRYRRRR